MDRRTFVAASVSLAIGAPAGHAADLSWLSVLSQLKEAYDEISEALDWTFWGQDAVHAVQLGKAPPPSPVSPQVFREMLEKEQARISALSLPVFEARLPDNGPVPTTSFDATRAALRSRMRALQDCISEV